MQEHIAANAELNEYLATMNENFQRQRPLEEQLPLVMAYYLVLQTSVATGGSLR